MTASPQTIANELLAKLAGFVDTEKSPIEFELAAFKREAKKLALADPAQSAMCFGIIACLEGDVEESKKQHEKSIRIGGELNLYLNYAYSLSRLGYVYAAYQCLEKALSKFPGEPALLKKIIGVSYNCGVYHKTLNYFDKLIATKADYDAQLDYIKMLSKKVLDLGVSAEVLDQAARFVDEVSIKHSVKINSNSLIAIEDEILRQIEINADVDTTVEMNFELFSKFAETESFDLHRLSVSFRSVT